LKDIYLISDTHFGHWFAVRFWNRPFENIKEMNNALIYNWNNRIKEDDIIIVLGDFFAGNRLFLKYLLNNLNGEKILIKGNHDFKFRYKKLLTEKEVSFYNRMEFSLDEYHFLLTHKPMKKLPDKTINIHGHHHKKLIPPKYEKHKYFNVAVEHNNYKPVALEEIIEDKLGKKKLDNLKIIEQIKYSSLNKKYAIAFA